MARKEHRHVGGGDIVLRNLLNRAEVLVTAARALPIGDALSEQLRLHEGQGQAFASDLVVEKVGISDEGNASLKGGPGMLREGSPTPKGAQFLPALQPAAKAGEECQECIFKS